MDTTVLLRPFSRKGLYTIITLLVSALGYFAVSRVKAVEAAAHSARTEAAHASTEANQAKRESEDAEAHAKLAMAEIREVREIIEDMRLQQLDHYRWQAEQARDWNRAEKYKSRLRELPPQAR